MKITDKVKLGSILFNKKTDQVEIVTIDTLHILIDLESKGEQNIYNLINILGTWLEEYFGFEKHYLGRNFMDVYTNANNGFRLHKTEGRNFQLGFTLKEGSRTFKKEIHSLNELDDCIFVFKGERLKIDDDLIVRINRDKIGW